MSRIFREFFGLLDTQLCKVFGLRALDSPKIGKRWPDVEMNKAGHDDEWVKRSPY